MNKPSPLPTASEPSTTHDLNEWLANETGGCSQTGQGLPPAHETAPLSGNVPALPEPETVTLNDDAADLADLINAMRAAMDPNSELDTDDPANWRGHHD